MRVSRTLLPMVLLGAGVLVLTGCSSGTGGPDKKKAAVVHEAKGHVQACTFPGEQRAVFFLSRATLPHGAPLPENWPEIEGRVGFIVGTNSTILKTADGGSTWRRVAEGKQGSPELKRVLFLSATEGWAVGRTIALHTSDGGESWNPAPPLPGIVAYFGDCTATATAFLQIKPPTCGATVYKAESGAKAWLEYSTQPRNDYAIIFFYDDLHGWMAGNHGMFAITEDGGKTWRAQDLPDGGNLVMLQFVSPKVGWLRPEKSTGVLMTADGGMTWQAKNASLATHWGVSGMQFLDEKVGFLLVGVEAGKTHVLRTLNGGDTWETIGKHNVDLCAMSFVDANHGWVVGSGGCVFHYDLGPVSPEK